MNYREAGKEGEKRVTRSKAGKGWQEKGDRKRGESKRVARVGKRGGSSNGAVRTMSFVQKKNLYRRE